MSHSTREVVTLQIGHYSNFVGAHWWNLQEASFVYPGADPAPTKEINHDVMFREGQTLAGDITYTPRLVAIDLKGSLNTLKEDGRLYDLHDQTEDIQWLADVTLHKSQSLPRNDFLKDLDTAEEVLLEGGPQQDSSECEQEKETTSREETPVFGRKFYDLDDSVMVWSDYLHSYLHPRSLQIIRDYRHQDDQLPFDVFGLGEQLLSSRELRNDLEDKLHFFFEECDHLQGIQMLADTETGFGGLATGLLEHVADDYGTKSLMLMGVHPMPSADATGRDHLQRVVNTAMSYERCSQHASCLLPLSVCSKLSRRPAPAVSYPHLQYQAALPYHSAAILAAGLESMSLPYRMCAGGELMPDLLSPLTLQGKKVLGLQMMLPLGLQQGESLVSHLLGLGAEAPWRPVSPMNLGALAPFAQSVVLQGVPAANIASLGSAPRGMHGRSAREVMAPRGLLGCRSAGEVMAVYLEDLYPSCHSASFSIETPCQVKTPFPHIFKDSVSCSGQLSPYGRGSKQGVEITPVLSALQCSPSGGTLLRELAAEAGRVDIRRHHCFLDAGLEEDEYKEITHNLLALADNYQHSSSTPGS